MGDDEKLRAEKMDTIKCGNLAGFIDYYFKKGITQETLLRRTVALEMFFKIELVDQMKTINCQSADIKSIVEFYVKMIFPSGKRHITCQRCKSKSYTSISLFSIDDNRWSLLKNSQNVDLSENGTCSKCNDPQNVTFTLNKFLFFVMDRNEMWLDIPKMAIFQGKHYKLSAIIEKISDYFVAHVQRPNQKWYTFNHTNKEMQRSDFKNPMKIQLFCFTQYTFYDEFTFQHILRNTHTLSYNDERIKINNACAPNCVFHCLACLYIDSPELFMQNSNEVDIMQFLNAYAKGQTDLMYDIRYKILSPHFNKKKLNDEIRMDCYTNVRGIMDKIIEKDFPSIITWCTCSQTIQQAFPVIDIDYKQYTSYGLNEIGKCITYPRRICMKCQSNVNNKSFGNFLFVDVEPLQLGKESINVEAKEVFISEIAQAINVNDTQYNLKAVIEFESPNHYTVNCLRSNSKWYNFDDLRQTIAETSCKLVPHILIYAKNVK